MLVMRLMLLYTTFAILFNVVYLHENQTDPDVETVVLRAVRGRPARLPCGNGRVFLDGSDSFILWLKDDRDLIYRYPNEDDERSVNSNHILGLPCDGDSCEDPTSLLLKRVTDQDSGWYRCRIHYQASPSVDYVYELKLVDAPGTPRIYDENEVEIVKGVMSPIGLGSDLNLICEVDDNRTETVVYWQRNGVMMERAHLYRPGVLRAEVHMPNVTRDELNAHYECLAQNADVSEPLVTGVVIKMYLAPLSVEIRTNNNNNFETGHPRVVDCVVVGCMPPPTVTWHLGDTMLKPSVHKELHDGNFTVSSLTLTASINNNQNDLVCRVHNAQIPGVFEDQIKINVGFRPICVTGQEEKIGIIPGELATATYIVESSPEPLKLSWNFGDLSIINTSASASNVKRLPGYATRYAISLTWKTAAGHFGKLLGQATNAFGEQYRPCYFHIIRGGAPLAPYCSATQYSPNARTIQCRKAWDGGKPQTVHLEVYNQEGELMTNVSDAAGNFNLPKLKGEQNITAVTYSSSSWGRSEERVIHLLNFKPATEPTVSGTTTAHTSFSSWMQLIGGVVMCFAVVGYVSYFSSKYSLRRRAAPPRPDAESNPDLVPRPDGSFQREPDVEETTNITVNTLSRSRKWSTIWVLMTSLWALAAAATIYIGLRALLTWVSESEADIELPDLVVPESNALSASPRLGERVLAITYENDGRENTVTVNRETPFLYNYIDDISDALEVVSPKQCCEQVENQSVPEPDSAPLPLPLYNHNDHTESRVPVDV